jgi:hypothetical protein
MNKEQQDYLVSKVGKLLTWTTLAAIGIDVGSHKPGRPQGEHKQCNQCDKPHCAKGLCLDHYMSARYAARVKRIKVNEFGQRIGKRGIALCDAEPTCEWQYIMKVKTQWKTDGKWYCNHHWQELFDKAKKTE